MSRIAKPLRADCWTRWGRDRQALAKRTVAALSVAAVSVVAPGWRPAPAGAGQEGGLQAEMAAAGARVRALTVAFEEAGTRAASLAQEVSASRIQLAQLTSALAATASVLRAEAVLSYVTGAGGAATAAAGGSDLAPDVRAEYVQLATSDLTDTAGQYRVEVDQAAAAENRLQRQVRASLSAQSAVAAARAAALADAARIQSQLTALQDQLQRLQAQAADRTPPVQGLPVNGGLVAAVRTIVDSTPAPAVTSPAATGVPAEPAATGVPAEPAAAGVPAEPAATGVPASPPAPAAGGVWLELRQCESGDNYRANTGNGFYGAYQFSQQTWTGLGFSGRPDLASPATQDAAARELQAQGGWGQWPACSAALGLGSNG